MTAFEAARDISAELRRAGHVAYLAGGCVRDRLLGNEPKDYDIATDATPDVVRTMFKGSVLVGEAFGVVLVRRNGHAVEVATFRTEGRYSDGRHPDAVAFSDAEHDARRRDFTINGIFEDPETGAIHDFVNGQADLAARVVRAIGAPAERIHEDELRMLRGVRFAARYDFEIEAATAAAIRDHGPALHGVSRERVGQELRWMLEHPTRARAASLLVALALDDVVLGPSGDAEGGDGVARLDGLAAHASYPLSLAAWARGRHGPGPLGPVVARWRDLLVLSNGERDRLSGILEVEDRVRREWPEMGVAGRKRLAACPEFSEALEVFQQIDHEAVLAIRDDVTELARTGLAPDRLLDGHALLGLGAAPGPEFGRLLDEVYDAQLEGTIRTRVEAEAWARRRLGRDG